MYSSPSSREVNDLVRLAAKLAGVVGAMAHEDVATTKEQGEGVMKRTLMILAIACIAGGVLASDIVLDIQLNGQELQDNQKVGKVLERGILVIEDFGAETNVHNGTLYLFESNSKGKGKAKGKKSSFVAEEAKVRIISSNKKQFGMLVELESACLAGIGKATMDKDGNYSQIIISSGQGTFLYAGFNEPPNETNAVPVDGISSNLDEVVEIDESVLEELETGKMQAKLNKMLTEAAKESSGVEAVEEWLGADES